VRGGEKYAEGKGGGDEPVGKRGVAKTISRKGGAADKTLSNERRKKKGGNDGRGLVHK